jgi:hypothetical protein
VSEKWGGGDRNSEQYAGGEGTLTPLKKKNLVLCKSGDSVFHFLYNPLGTRKSIIRDQTEGPLDSNPKTQFIFLFSVAEVGEEGMSC